MDTFSNDNITLTYINATSANAVDNKARWELDIDFQHTNSRAVLWDVSQGIGDFQNILLEANQTIDLETTGTYFGKLAAILGPNDIDPIRYVWENLYIFWRYVF